ncbi:MAG: J domain-containing protein [Cyanobacteria bacterium J083]|nr:MAG: J domain-containing protein [Cyanobacteria bacterium J083]
MSFSIKHGLFKLGITDHNAVLGMPINTQPEKIRLKYLKIAQKLHPDTCKSANKELANQILAKLVNPSYEHLSKESCWKEYQIILEETGKRLAKQQNKITINSPLVSQLYQSAAHTLDLTYQKVFQAVAQSQYQTLEQITLKIAQLSEINLVYLMLKASHNHKVSKPNLNNTERKTQKNSQTNSTDQSQTGKITQDLNSNEAKVLACLRRAQEYIDKKSFVRATLELKDALKIDPKNSTCHGLIGLAYLEQNQITMAKVHIKQGYQLNPNDPVVVKSKKAIEPICKITEPSSNSAKNSTQANHYGKKPKTRGILNSLFGGKKK